MFGEKVTYHSKLLSVQSMIYLQSLIERKAYCLKHKINFLDANAS